MNTMIDILQRFSEQPEWQADEEIPLDEKEVDKRAWNAVMKQIEEPFELLSDAVDKGLEHAAICLELLPRPQKRTPVGSLVRRLSMRHPDVESGREPRPGDANFARIIADKMEAFQAKKGKLLKKWLQERCIDIDDDRSGLARFRTEHDQVQLYIILYMETLMHEAGEAVQDLVDFADEKVRNGTMSRKRLIAPTLRRLRKWFISVFRSSEEDSAKRSEEAIDEGTNPIYCFGPGFAPKRDLEHLPPATLWQRSSNVLRKISGVLSSDASMFGFRVSCATLTIGILAFLEDTARFFREHRLVWALIAVTLGMTISEFSSLCVSGNVEAMFLTSLISLRSVLLQLSLQDRRDLYSHGTLPHLLVHCGRQSTRRLNLSVVVSLHHLLLLRQVSAFFPRSHYLHSYTGCSSWIRVRRSPDRPRSSADLRPALLPVRSALNLLVDITLER
jgi:hypothetical protein